MTANWVNYLNIYVTESFWLVRSPKAAKCLKMACQISELGKKQCIKHNFSMYTLPLVQERYLCGVFLCSINVPGT